MTETPITTTSGPRRAHRHPWLGLLVILGPVLLVSMDGSVLFLTMPAITRDLEPTADQALWILDVYGFAVGSLLITFGSLGDRYGRLKFLLGGVIVFGAGSVGAALAQSPEALIGARILMGLGGATLLPSGLAVLSELFANPRQRSRAIAVFSATFATGFAIGPVIGGLLLSRFTWHSVFLINIPVVALFLILAPFVLREVRSTRPGKVDLVSVILSAGGILLVIYSVKDLAAYGPSWEVLLYAVTGAAGLTWFIRRQRTLEYPLLDIELFRERVFSVAIATGVLSLVAWSSGAYLTGIYLQSILDKSVLTAAVLALPGAVVLTSVCITTPWIVDRVGSRTTLVLCHFSMAAGLLLLLFTGSDGGVGWFIASTAVAGVGYGISFALVADTAVSAVPPERAGSAGSIAETSNEIGNALGIALLGSTATLIFRLLGPDVAPTLDETLATDITAEAALQAKEAFTTGMHVAVGFASVLCVGLGLLALRWIPVRVPREH